MNAAKRSELDSAREFFRSAAEKKFPTAERFDLRISGDVSEGVLPKLFKAVTRDPEFTVIMDGDCSLETLGKS